MDDSNSWSCSATLYGGGTLSEAPKEIELQTLGGDRPEIQKALN